MRAKSSKRTAELILTTKQRTAWERLHDDVTKQILFGGGAGGGKTRLGCSWAIEQCLKYPGVRGCIGRSKLKQLKLTTLRTFFEVARDWKLEAGVDFTYNQQDSVIYFANGSEILLVDLFLFPSDPDFDRLGSLELTFAFIDEASQVTLRAKNILMSRIRYKLDDFGLIPKLLMTCNPAKNWTYLEFYKPNKAGELPEKKAFIQALATENPFVSRHYIDNLHDLDTNSKQRLLFGNWEFDNDPARLFDIVVIGDLFTNNGRNTDKAKPEKWVTVDVARDGSDAVVITHWEDFHVVKIERFSKKLKNMWKDKTAGLVKHLEKIEKKKKIRRSRFIIDEDGIGGGVVDHFKGCRGFRNNARPIQPKKLQYMDADKREIHKVNYSNLKSQCWFKLAQMAEQGLIGIDCDEDIHDIIIEDLEQIKRKNMHNDEKKLAVISKDEIKEKIGRSTDIGDTLMMRMLPTLGKGKHKRLIQVQSPTLTKNIRSAKM